MHQGDDDSRSFSTLLSSLLLSLSEISSLAKDSQIEREAMSEFALFVERIAPILTDRKEIEAADAAPIREAVESLENELNRSHNLVLTDMNNILMATELSRMELTDQSRAALGDEGSIQALVKMFNSGKLEAKLSSLGALQNLSTLTENVHRLISSGIVCYMYPML